MKNFDYKIFIIISVILFALQITAYAKTNTVSGKVYNDSNRNQQLDSNESGIPNVCVSNGLQVVQTNDKGHYTLPVRNPMHIFVIKPSGYDLPLNSNNIPDFYHLHAPEGSPDNIQQYRGLESTGNLPDNVNFPLHNVQTENSFSTMVIADPQVKNQKQLSYFRDSFIENNVDSNSSLALVLGDNVEDNLSLYPRYLKLMSSLDVPTLYVPGNHDLDRDSADDTHSLDTYQSYFGPPYYAYNIGKIHLVIMDNVIWDGSDYQGKLNQKQLTWLKNDLANVPEDKLIVLAMHVPIVSWIYRNKRKHMLKNRDKLFEILENRNVVALAGHTHTLEHLRPGEEFGEWNTPLPFTQIVCGAVCGSWWSGPLDKKRVPFSYQREGSPRGYGIMKFKNNQYSWSYRALNQKSDYNMHIGIWKRSENQPFPQDIISCSQLDKTSIVANVFRGSRDLDVKCTLDNSTQLTMKRNFSIPDPFAFKLTSSLDKWLRPMTSSHVWSLQLPKSLDTGIHTAKVKAKDRFGNNSTSTFVFEVSQ